MNVREPRFLVIDLHKRQVVPATTEEMRALVTVEELSKSEIRLDTGSNLLVSDHEFTSRT